MNCVYTYNGVNYSYAELAAALHGGLLEKLVTDGVVGGEVSLNPDERVEEVRVETDVKSGIESSDELTTETNVDNVGGILDVVGNIKNKKIESQYGSINTGDIEVVKSIPNVNKVIAKGDNGVEIKVVINGDKLNGTLLSKNGNYLFRAMQGRYFILAKVGDFYLPFYISSAGTSGKIQGQWYPFFGYNNWLVKGRVGKNGEMKYSEKISKVQTLLNENFILPAKYLSADNKVAIGEQFVPARNSKGDIIREGKYNFEKMIPNEKRKVLYDLSEDIDVITHHHQEQKKETRLNEHDWVAEKTGFNPKNVVNDGGLSADNWINDIIALTENVEQASNGVIKKSAYLIEEIQDATKITSAEGVDVRQQARDGESVGEGNAQKEEVAEKEEEKEVKERTWKEIKREVVTSDVMDEEHAILQYFAGGGKINPKLIDSIYGVKNNEEHNKIKTAGEKKARIGMLSKKSKATNVDSLTELIYDSLDYAQKSYLSFDKIRDNVEGVIGSYVSARQMANAFLDKKTNNIAAQEARFQQREVYEDLTDEEVDAAMETPEIIEAAELTYDTLSDEQKAAFDGLIERFTVDGVTDYDAINKAMEDFNFEADEIFVFNVNQLLDNNLKSVLDDYQKRSQNQDIIGEDANKEGVAQKELAEQTRAAEEALISARKDYDNKKRQLGKDLLAEQPEMFEEKDETVLFETDANVSQANIDAILKPYADAVKLAQARVDELTSPAMLEKAKSADDAQAKINLKVSNSETVDANGSTPANIKEIKRKYPDAVVVNSAEELPDAVKQHIKELGVTGVMGVEYEGKVYMVAGNIKTMEQAEATYRHEVLGHKNVNEYLADTLPAFALSVVKEADAEQRKQLEKIAKDYFGKSLDALANSEKRVVGKEYIARIAEGGIKEPSVLQKIRDFFRDAFRALGIKLNVKDSEIRGLIYNADRLVKTGKKGVTLRIAQKMAKRSMTDVINSALKGYGINLQINGDLQQVSNEVAANIMREGSRISDKPYYAYAKKKLGEGTAKMMVEYMAKAVEASEARDANLITDFLLNKIPVKSNVLPIMELMGGELTTEFMNSLNQTAQEKQAQEVKRRSPFDVAKEAGFEMFEAKDESTLQSFKTYYRHSNGSYWQEHETPTSDGELICSIYNGGRWQSRYVFFVRNNNWENIVPADKLTQDNISKEWAEYLEKKGRKKEDGTYDLSGLRREREDPYSTSMLSIQVSKTGGAVDIISRYNHNVDNPNNTFNTSKKRVDSEYIDGLWESILVYTGFERKLKEGGNDLPENVKKSGGKYYFVSKEKDGEYWGDNFVIANNPAVYSEKYGNGVSVDGNVVSFNRDKYVTIEGVVYEKGKAYYSEISGIPVNKITQSKDDVEATYENGDYKYTVKLKIANGVVVKLWSDIESVGNDSIRDMAALTTLELPQVASVGNHSIRYMNALTTLELPQVASVGNYSIRDMAALTTLELPQVASVGNYSIVDMNALTTLELPQVASVGNGSIGYMDNIQTIIIQEVVKMGYDSFDIREDAEIIRPENHPKYKLQTEITFTQSLMNDAIGIGDETDMQQLEDKGIIKKECE